MRNSTLMVRLSVCLMVLCILPPVEAKTLAYIPSQGSNTVTVINTANDQIVKKYKRLIPDRAGPFGVAVSPSHGNLFVSHPFYKPAVGAPDLVTMIQPDARKQAPLNIAVQDGAYGIAMDPSGWKVYQANAASGSISVLSAAGALRANLDTQLRWPMGIVAVNINNQTQLFVTENQGNSVAIVDPVYGRLLKRITVGAGPIGIVASPDGTRVYVANFSDSSVSVIDTAHQTVLQTTPVIGQPYGLTLSTDAQTLFAALQNTDDRQRPLRGEVAFFDAMTLTERLRVKVGKTPTGVSVAMTPRGEKLYVTNYGSNSVSVIATSVSSPRIIKTLAVGSKPAAFGSFVAETAPDGIPSTIANFMGDAVAGWAKAQIFQQLGITVNANVIYQQLNTIIGDLASIQQQLTTMENQIQGLTNLFYDLQSEMNQANYINQAQFLNQIETGAAFNWNLFVNSAGGQTLEGLLSSSVDLDALQGVLTDSYLTTIATVAAQLSGTGSGSNVFQPNNTIYAYLTTAANYLNSQSQSLLNQGGNIMAVGTWTPVGQPAQQLSIFDQYNNALMNQYQYIIQVLQQAYTVEVTTLYLQANLPNQFGTIRLTEPGVVGQTTPANYTAQVATLNSIYSTRIQNVSNAFASAVVSDAGGAPPVLPARTGTAQSSKYLANIPNFSQTGGNWNQYASNGNGLSLFVWQGLLPQGEVGFWGAWDGTTLTGQSPTGWSAPPSVLTAYSINAKTQNCQYNTTPSLPTGINYWQVSGWPGQLQCMGLNGYPPVAPGGAGQNNILYNVSIDDPHAYFYFNLPSGNANFFGQSLPTQMGPNIFSTNSSSSGANQYKAETRAALINQCQPPCAATGWFFGNFTYTSPTNGYMGQYIIGGSGYQDPNGPTVHWFMGLECVTGPFCYTLGNDGICLGGNYLVANQDNGNSSTIQNMGLCPPPSNTP